MKKPYISLAIGAAILLILAIIFVGPYLDNRAIQSFSGSLLAMPVPAQTQKIETLTKIGQQSGNSDHCDYFAAIMLKTGLPKSEAENYFRSKYSGTSQLNFFWLDEQATSTGINPMNIWTLEDWKKNKSQDNPTNLVVYLYEGSFNSGFDYRCGLI